jgi:LPXTG-motif cell wall-anchored protein
MLLAQVTTGNDAGDVVWLIVGVLAIIALLAYIIGFVKR